MASSVDIRIFVFAVTILFLSICCSNWGISKAAEDETPLIGAGGDVEPQPIEGGGAETHHGEDGVAETHHGEDGVAETHHGEDGGAETHHGEDGGTEPLVGEGGGGVYGDPAQIVARALLCFNDKYIYKSCEDSYRLDQKGDLHVPPEYTDEYCQGPCLTETNLVLSCIDGIFSHFHFYNHATIRDVRDTIHAGCGYGPERGNFDVAEHLQAGSANRISNQMLLWLGLMVLGWMLNI